MKFNFLNEIIAGYKSSLENKMLWARSQVDMAYEDVRKHIEQEASNGNKYTNISLDII